MPTIGQEEFATKAKQRLLEITDPRTGRPLSIAAIARKWGKQRNTISLAIHHPRLLPHVHRRVAKFLNLTPAV